MHNREFMIIFVLLLFVLFVVVILLVTFFMLSMLWFLPLLALHFFLATGAEDDVWLSNSPTNKCPQTGVQLSVKMFWKKLCFQLQCFTHAIVCLHQLKAFENCSKVSFNQIWSGPQADDCMFLAIQHQTSVAINNVVADWRSKMTLLHWCSPNEAKNDHKPVIRKHVTSGNSLPKIRGDVEHCGRPKIQMILSSLWFTKEQRMITAMAKKMCNVLPRCTWFGACCCRMGTRLVCSATQTVIPTDSWLTALNQCCSGTHSCWITGEIIRHSLFLLTSIPSVVLPDGDTLLQMNNSANDANPVMPTTKAKKKKSAAHREVWAKDMFEHVDC